jgi:hypothetical protein
MPPWWRWQRRWPCEALTVSSAAIAAQVVVVGRTPPSGFLYAGPTLIGAYSVGAWAPWSRRAFAALAAMVIAYDGLYAPAEGLSGSFNAISTELVWSVLPAAMWLLGHQVRRAGRPRQQRMSSGVPSASASSGALRHWSRSAHGWPASCTTFSLTA